MTERKRSLLCLAAAFLLPAALFTLTLYRNQIVPFGETTLLISDLDTQYIEFMAEYRRILLGEGSLFYSWNAGLGLNFLALIAYYLASPFNLLLVLFSEAQLPLAVSVITILKLSCAGLAFGIYLKRRFPHSADARLPLLAAGYALSAWAVGYAFNIMWLDALIWLPLLCTEIDALLASPAYHPRPLLLILFTFSFISQFYVAAMSGFFCVLYLFAQLITQKTSGKKCFLILLSFALSAGLAAGLSAFLMVPTFLVLKNNMGLIGQGIPAPGGQFPFFSLFRKLFLGSFDGTKDCLPHIYCGLPALLGLVRYFLSKAIPAREKRTHALLGAFLLFCFWFRPLDFILHIMDVPSWFPYRYAFIFTFWMVSRAAEGFYRDEQPQLPAALLILLLLTLCFFPAREENRNLWLLNLGFLAGYALLSRLPRQDFRTIAALLLCAAELAVHCGWIIGGNQPRYTKLADWQTYHEKYSRRAAPLLPASEDFYRLEKTNFRNYNDALGIGFPGMSHFSSTASTRQSEYLKRLGFDCYATWCTYNGATAASNALLRIRYTIDPDSVTRNAAQLPLFYPVSEEYTRFDYASDAFDPIQRQDRLLGLLANGESCFSRSDPKPVKMDNLKSIGDGNYQRPDPQQPASLTYEIPVDPDLPTYLFTPGVSLNCNVHTGSARNVISAGRNYTPFPILLNDYAQDGSITVVMEPQQDVFYGAVRVYTLDDTCLNGITDSVNAAAPRIERTGFSKFHLSFEPADEERIIASSIPFDSGWEVLNQGEGLRMKTIHEGMLGFLLPAECTEVDISYCPTGWRLGCLISFVSAVAAVVLIGIIPQIRKKGS